MNTISVVIVIFVVLILLPGVGLIWWRCRYRLSQKESSTPIYVTTTPKASNSAMPPSNTHHRQQRNNDVCDNRAEGSSAGKPEIIARSGFGQMLDTSDYDPSHYHRNTYNSASTSTTYGNASAYAAQQQGQQQTLGATPRAHYGDGRSLTSKPQMSTRGFGSVQRKFPSPASPPPPPSSVDRGAWRGYAYTEEAADMKQVVSPLGEDFDAGSVKTVSPLGSPDIMR
ncbi:hypothetical protein BX600DRAFT_110293 [Xylariales sp. PMI_506]|nr:hypothetical protein BX600DRAFT_110293 [Xylariales sp. PMI_506]